MLQVSGKTAPAGADGVSGKFRESSPFGCGGLNRHLTPVPVSGPYNWPAASGQRPAA